MASKSEHCISTYLDFTCLSLCCRSPILSLVTLVLPLLNDDFIGGGIGEAGIADQNILLTVLTRGRFYYHSPHLAGVKSSLYL